MTNFYVSSKGYEAITPWGGQQNMLLQSNTFNNTAWTTNALNATATQGTDGDPFGGTLAWRLIDNVTNALHYVEQSVTKSAAATRYMFSCYAKAGPTLTRIRLGIYGIAAQTNGYQAAFDLTNGQIGVSGALVGAGWTAGIYKIEPVLGQAGWYRCEVSAVTSTETVVISALGTDSGTGTAAASATYAGASNYVLIYGAQLEPSLYVCGTYTGTTTAAATQTVSFSATLNMLRRETDPGKDVISILATLGLGAERVFKCTTAGTTGSVEPIASNGNPWNLSKNGTTTDNAAVWTEVTGQESAQVAGTWAPWARINHFQTTRVYVASFSLTAAGTGYAANDIVAITGGTVYGEYAFIKVLTVTTGAIATFSTLSGGSYSAASGALATTKITGAGTGATFTPTTAQQVGIVAGDNIYLGNLHNEWNNVAVTVTFPGTAASPTIITSVDQSVSGAIPPTSSTVLSGAKITTTGGALTLNAAFEMYGVTLQAVNSNNLVLGGSNVQRYFNCLMVLSGGGSCTTSSGGSGPTYWENTPFKTDGTGSVISIPGPFYWRNTASAIQGIATPSNLLAASNFSNGLCICEGLDLSGLGTGKQLTSHGAMGPIQVIRCKLPGSLTVAPSSSTINHNSMEIIQCDSGGLVTRNERYWVQGTHTTDTSVVRTGGASDGGTPVSWKIAPTANNTFGWPFETMKLAAWNATTGSTVNVNVYGVCNIAAPNTLADLWLEIDYFGTAGSTLGSIATQQPANRLVAGTALTADTSAWDTAATARANTTAYSLGNAIAVSSNTGRIFICTTAGTSNGSLPVGYASAVDGGTVTDGTAVFIAGYRFKQTLSVTPQIAGYIFATIKVPKASTTALYWIDFEPTLS